jgi:hypothetical protein
MSGVVYLDEPWLSVRWDAEHHCVHSEWKGFATSTEFRIGTMKMLEAIRDKHASALLTDTRKLEAVGDEDQLWVRDTWIPLATRAGLKRLAVVVAHSGLGRFAVDEMIKHDGVTAYIRRTFESLPEAMWWLVEEK